MTKKQRSQVLNVWVKVQVLCGVLDEKVPEDNFPKGRVKTAWKLALEALKILNKMDLGT